MVGLPTVMTTATFDCFSHREAQPRACVTAACSAAVFGDRKRGKPGNKSYAGERSDDTPSCASAILSIHCDYCRTNHPATARYPPPSMAADNRTSAARTHATSSASGLPIQVVEKEKLLDDLEQMTPKGHPAADKWTVRELVAITVFAVLSLLAFAGLYYSGPG